MRALRKAFLSLDFEGLIKTFFLIFISILEKIPDNKVLEGREKMKINQMEEMMLTDTDF